MPRDGHDLETLFKAADLALYRPRAADATASAITNLSSKSTCAKRGS